METNTNITRSHTPNTGATIQGSATSELQHTERSTIMNTTINLKMLPNEARAFVNGNRVDVDTMNEEILKMSAGKLKPVPYKTLLAKELAANLGLNKGPAVEATASLYCIDLTIDETGDMPLFIKKIVPVDISPKYRLMVDYIAKGTFGYEILEKKPDDCFTDFAVLVEQVIWNQPSDCALGINDAIFEDIDLEHPENFRHDMYVVTGSGSMLKDVIMCFYPKSFVDLYVEHYGADTVFDKQKQKPGKALFSTSSCESSIKGEIRIWNENGIKVDCVNVPKRELEHKVTTVYTIDSDDYESVAELIEELKGKSNIFVSYEYIDPNTGREMAGALGAKDIERLRNLPVPLKEAKLRGHHGVTQLETIEAIRVDGEGLISLKYVVDFAIANGYISKTKAKLILRYESGMAMDDKTISKAKKFMRDLPSYIQGRLCGNGFSSKGVWLVTSFRAIRDEIASREAAGEDMSMFDAYRTNCDIVFDYNQFKTARSKAIFTSSREEMSKAANGTTLFICKVEKKKLSNKKHALGKEFVNIFSNALEKIVYDYKGGIDFKAYAPSISAYIQEIMGVMDEGYSVNDDISDMQYKSAVDKFMKAMPASKTLVIYSLANQLFEEMKAFFISCRKEHHVRLISCDPVFFLLKDGCEAPASIAIPDGKVYDSTIEDGLLVLGIRYPFNSPNEAVLHENQHNRFIYNCFLTRGVRFGPADGTCELEAGADQDGDQEATITTPEIINSWISINSNNPDFDGRRFPLIKVELSADEAGEEVIVDETTMCKHIEKMKKAGIGEVVKNCAMISLYLNTTDGDILKAPREAWETMRTYYAAYTGIVIDSSKHGFIPRVNNVMSKMSKYFNGKIYESFTDGFSSFEYENIKSRFEAEGRTVSDDEVRHILMSEYAQKINKYMNDFFTVGYMTDDNGGFIRRFSFAEKRFMTQRWLVSKALGFDMLTETEMISSDLKKQAHADIDILFSSLNAINLPVSAIDTKVKTMLMNARLVSNNTDYYHYSYHMYDRITTSLIAFNKNTDEDKDFEQFYVEMREEMEKLRNWLNLSIDEFLVYTLFKRTRQDRNSGFKRVTYSSIFTHIYEEEMLNLLMRANSEPATYLYEPKDHNIDTVMVCKDSTGRLVLSEMNISSYRDDIKETEYTIHYGSEISPIYKQGLYAKRTIDGQFMIDKLGINIKCDKQAKISVWYHGSNPELDAYLLNVGVFNVDAITMNNKLSYVLKEVPGVMFNRTNECGFLVYEGSSIVIDGLVSKEITSSGNTKFMLVGHQAQ